MTKIKKILLVSCTAGAGHKRAAEALRLTCDEHFPEYRAEHIDLMDYSDWIVRKTVTSTYHFMTRHLPALYGLLYNISDYTRSAKTLNLFSSMLKINIRKLHKYVAAFAPDRIICTHFLASAFLKNFSETIPTDMLVTDYELNKIVLDPKIRYFFAPTEQIAKEINQAGKTSFATGIPLHPEFFKEKNIEIIRRDFNLKKGWPTVLLLSGGTGIIDSSLMAEDIINNFKDINLIAISGRHNPRLLQKLNILAEKTGSINYRVIEFTERIDELMRASQVVISKPGGLTLTECLHLKKPILIIDPIPGQEEANADFAEKNNYGRQIADHNELVEILRKVLNSEIVFTPAQLPKDAARNILARTLK